MKDKQWYVDQHRNMWNWIADQIEGKRATQSILVLKSKWCALNAVWPKHYCFGCEYDSTHWGYLCQHCLFDWGAHGPRCYCEDGIYGECKCAKKWQEQAAMARKIADLPVREDV